MFYEIAQEYANDFIPFKAYAKAKDRQKWNTIDKEWSNKCLELGNTYLNYSYPQINATDFMEFTRTGNRTHFEDKQFAKRKALSALVLAECVQHDGKYMDDIVNGIFSICEESAWFLPAHNTYIRDSKQLPLPDACDPVLELFSCETGAVLSTVLYLLEDELNEVSPFIAKRIRYELDTRIFKPYLNHHFWWMGNGSERMCNWTIWCTQNVLISAFLSGNLAADITKQIFLKACQSTDYFLADYGDDGCCDEGAQYYRHAGLCLFNVIDILDKVSGKFSSLYNNTKIRNIATYIMNMHVAGPYYFNFADCSPIAGRAGSREFLFADAIGNELMKSYAATDYFATLASLVMQDENNLYYRLQNAFALENIRKYAKMATYNTVPKELYYKSTGIFITGDNYFSLAAKAGNNADSHNHNDTGSFTIYADGQPFIIDIGVESYTQKTFSDRRYEIWTMQSAYHNLPTVSGVMQMDGEKYHASNVEYSFNDKESSICMDIANAYPLENVLHSYLRKIVLHKNSHIDINDTIEYDGKSDDIVLSIMTYEEPTAPIAGSISVGSLGILEYSGCDLEDIEVCPITDARLAIAWKHDIYRILLRAKSSNIDLKIHK